MSLDNAGIHEMQKTDNAHCLASVLQRTLLDAAFVHLAILELLTHLLSVFPAALWQRLSSLQPGA